ncbi:MAG: glycerate kinase [Actinomycetota bacterium]
MRVLVAPDKFKGTLTAAQAAEAIARGCRDAGADVDVAPVADGGEGTLEALVAAAGGTIMGVIARGPLGLPVRAHIAQLRDGTGVVELSQASGLRLVDERDRDPLRASTLGTGEMIKGALARRPQRLLIAIGGSATVDGGTGLARALGVRFYDHEGKEVEPGGEGLERIARIETKGLDARFGAIEVDVAADVMAPLTGDHGAARMYGPQKGASPQVVERLARGLENLGEVVERDLGVQVLDAPGAGAAGGAGAMLLGLGAHIRSGADVVLDAMGFDERLKAADLVITGEGRLDESTLDGKAPGAVARAAQRAGVPCVALVGSATIKPDLFADVLALDESQPGNAASGLGVLAARLVSARR